MKPIFLLFFFFTLVTSCTNDAIFPRVEEITKGSKWNLKIGDTPANIYNQLQLLGYEKKFYEVSIVYRKPYLKPEQVKNIIGFYNAITLENTAGQTERALIQFSQNKVSSIEIGGGILHPAISWPQNIPNKIAIRIGDSVDKVYENLLEIYKFYEYNTYQIILPDKPLNKAFDPDMVNYTEWAFTFSENIIAGKIGRSSVRLYFTNSNLTKIRHEYEEFDIVN